MVDGRRLSRCPERAGFAWTSPRPVGILLEVNAQGLRSDLTCERCGHPVAPGSAFCAHCGAALVGTSAPREERKLVSILFVDLEGFTASADAADPEDVRDALGRYHDVARERIEAYGGVVEKFIGDAVMAVFGAPVAHSDDAERAVRAGLRVLEAVAELREQGFALGARAAVNTGEAIVSVNRRDAGEALAIGDVVNTASRLQSAAPVGSLVVGPETRRATRHAIAYEELPASVAKGQSEPDRDVARDGRDLGAGRTAGDARPVRRPDARARPDPLGVAPGDGRLEAAPGHRGRVGRHREVEAVPRDRRGGRRRWRALAPGSVSAVRGADRVPRSDPDRATGVRDLRLGPTAGRRRQARRGRRAARAGRGERGHGALPRVAARARNRHPGREPAARVSRDAPDDRVPRRGAADASRVRGHPLGGSVGARPDRVPRRATARRTGRRRRPHPARAPRRAPVGRAAARAHEHRPRSAEHRGDAGARPGARRRPLGER